MENIAFLLFKRFGTDYLSRKNLVDIKRVDIFMEKFNQEILIPFLSLNYYDV